MKIYIMTDMEGVSGIYNEEQTQPGASAYEAARHLLCEDVNAAIAGAFEGGAQEVLVCDGHNAGTNIIMEDMDSRAELRRPGENADLMTGLDESFAGVFCVGYHAMAGTLNGFLDHTQSSKSWFNYYLNDRRCGELAQVGAWAGSYGVPILLVTGDQAACDEAGDFFGPIETVSVKQGAGRQFAHCLPPEKATLHIREGARRAISLVNEAKPFRVEIPLTIRLELYRSDMADAISLRPGTRRTDARTLERTVEDVRELLSF